MDSNISCCGVYRGRLLMHYVSGECSALFPAHLRPPTSQERAGEGENKRRTARSHEGTGGREAAGSRLADSSLCLRYTSNF